MQLLINSWVVVPHDPKPRRIEPLLPGVDLGDDRFEGLLLPDIGSLVDNRTYGQERGSPGYLLSRD